VSAGRPWIEAWQEALYGTEGFYRRNRPSDAFRTAAIESAALARAVATLCEREGLDAVVDVGAGDGRLLARLAQDTSLRLTGVDIGRRPQDLPEHVHWSDTVPDQVDGLLFAHELLDVVPCTVAEVAPDHTVRVVHVDLQTGEESLGEPVDEVDLEWLRTWWPVSRPGDRAEVGSTRDALWADLARRVAGLAVAVDYGHLRDSRPQGGSLQAYQNGSVVDVVPDGTRDITAHVAVDSVAAATGARCIRQREALRELGVTGRRPPHELAIEDPQAYLSALVVASDEGAVLDRDGWGGFWWIVTDTRQGHAGRSDRLTP
jgi:SAM-dependent MidA family methyltransferase